MGNYTSNGHNLAEKKMIAENGLENKLLTLGQPQQQQHPATTAAIDQQQQQPKQSNNDIEMKHLNSKKKIVMDEQDIKMILQTFDVFINQVLQEKLSKLDGGSVEATKPPSSATVVVNKEPSYQAIFDNLAKMLSTHLDDYLEHCKRSGIVMASAYKSCQEYVANNNNNNNNNISCCNHQHHPQLVVEPQQSDQQQQQQPRRRMSSIMTLQGSGDVGNSNSNNNNNSTLDFNNKNNLNNVVNMDNIRINLPEILDQQDEVTIMRLLIKLLSNKVRKLSDENRFLLQQISALNDINNELASILQRKFGK